jgi:hypothetical protein
MSIVLTLEPFFIVSVTTNGHVFGAFDDVTERQ